MSDIINISKTQLAKAFSILAAGIITGTTNVPPTKEQLDQILNTHLENDYVVDLVEGFASDFDNYEEILANPQPVSDEDVQLLAHQIMGGTKVQA